MGGFLCCFQVPDHEEQENVSGSDDRGSNDQRCFGGNFVCKCKEGFCKKKIQALPQADRSTKSHAQVDAVASNDGNTEDPSKILPEIVETNSGCVFNSSDDEDVCPTCLEEYSEENPKKTLRCGHDFHLGCIYEWMERSEACPFCAKMMLFEESF